MPDTSGHWRLFDFVPKLQGDGDKDWVTWNRAFTMGITAIDPRFKEITDGTLRAPENHNFQCSSFGLLSADETKSPNDMAEGKNGTPHAAITEYSRIFTQLNAIGSILLRMTLGPVPMELITYTPDLKAAYHALSCEYGRYNNRCEYWSCNGMTTWMNVKFHSGDHLSDFLVEWRDALDDLLFDHERDLQEIFDVFIKAIRDHDGFERFFHSLQFDHSSMDMVYRQFMQHSFQ